ncbi:MAG: hypothetical protein GDA44_05705 [Prochloron sp. SP5CPC1]|nr:hypothetical protein [Candidatus Paraprochloron terpiosi SP5CPC1]
MDSEVKLSEDILELEATRWGEKLTQTIAMENLVGSEGRWEVAPHESDPPHTTAGHAWISLTPGGLVDNAQRLKILVDTSKLMVGKIYERQIFFHGEETRSFTVKVKTAPRLIAAGKLPYFYPVVLLAISFAVVFGVAFPWTKAWVDWFIVGMFGIGTLIGALFGTVAVKGALVGTGIVVLLITVAKFSLGYVGVFWDLVLAAGVTVVYLVVGIVISAGIKALLTAGMKNFARRGYEQSFAFLLLLLAAGLGMSLAMAPLVGFLEPFITATLAGTILPMGLLLLYPQFKQRRLIAKYRQEESQLIKEDRGR